MNSARNTRPSFPPRALARRTQLIALGIAALLAVLAFILIPAIVSHFSRPNEAVAEAPPPGTFRATDSQWATLKVTEVKTLAFRSEDETDGKIATNDDTTTPVFSPYSGRVTRVFAKAGDTVHQGDPLFAVEASEFVQGQNDLVAAVAALNTAQAQLTLAQTAERRAHDLFDAKGGALKDWQQAQVDLANANGNARTAEIALAAVRNRLRILGKSDAEIAQIERRSTQGMAAEAMVPAPISGTVISRQIGIGQYISSAAGGGNPVFAIGNLASVWFVANVREEDSPSMRLGQTVEVRVMAYPDKVFTARITYVSPTIDPATRRLTVRAEVDNADGALKPEMFARFRIITSAETEAPAIPEAAIVREGDVARVWVADADKSISLRRIKVGRSREDGLVEVVEGLQPGERVVSSGALFIDRAASAP